jgi:hypothetical protein
MALEGANKAKAGDMETRGPQTKALPIGADADEGLSRLQQEVEKMNPIMLPQNERHAMVRLATWVKELGITVLALGRERNALKKENEALKQQLQQNEQQQLQQQGSGGGSSSGVGGAAVTAVQAQLAAMEKRHKAEMEELKKAHKTQMEAALKGVAKEGDLKALQSKVEVQGKAVVAARQAGERTAQAVHKVAQQQSVQQSRLQQANVVVRGVPSVKGETAERSVHIFLFKGLEMGELSGDSKFGLNIAGVDRVKVLPAGPHSVQGGINAVVMMRSVQDKMDLFSRVKRMKGKSAYAKVKVDDDLTKENREKQQAMLVKRREMLKKKEAEAVVVRNHNMEPVMVAKIGGVWRVGTAEVKGRWEAGKALEYKWDFSREAKGAERPVTRDARAGVRAAGVLG